MADFRFEDEQEKSYDPRLMRRLLRYAVPHWKALLLCVALVGVTVVLMLTPPKLVEMAIELYLVPGVDTPEAQAGIVRLAVLLAASLLMLFIVDYGQRVLLQYTGSQIIYTIRKDLFAHLQRLHLKFFDSNPAGRLVTRVTNDTETLNQMYTSVLVNLFRDVFMLGGIAVVMFLENAQLALVSLALLPVIGLYSFYFIKQVRAAWRVVRIRLARINAFLAEHVGGMKIIQLFAREAETYQEFKRENDHYFEATWNQLKIWAVFRPVLDVLANLAIAILLWYGGHRYLDGNLSIGDLYLFTTLIRRFFQPLLELSEKFNIMQSAMASSERLFKLMDEEPAITEPENPVPLGRVRGEVEFRNVWFAYDDEEWVLRDVSFRAEPGQTIAFVGHTGAGKSSIINLLTRFYDVQKGEVLIDGVNVKDVALKDLRQNIGLVAQDVFLFTGDIKSNIRLGNEQITDEQVIAAAKAVEADPFIRALPGGYDEQVVERGATLSAGQRQLISFARTLAFDPAILVLDEATANIDSETEAVIQRALRRLTKGRTTFIVAHRLSTIQHADQILVLHKGKIRERGTHEELLQQQGLYHKLWRLQFEEQAERDAASGPGPRAASGS